MGSRDLHLSVAALTVFLFIDIVTLAFAVLKAPYPSYTPLGPPTAYRSIYIHVPIAEASLFILTVAAITAGYYLYTSKHKMFELMHAMVLVGLAYAAATLITGSIWAKVSWGVAWNWDPRQTSVFFLFVAYLVYLAIKASIKDPDKAPRISAAYAVAAWATVPLSFIAPYISESLHPRVYETKGFLVGLAGALFGIRTLIVIAICVLLAYLYYRRDIHVPRNLGLILAAITIITAVAFGVHQALILSKAGSQGYYYGVVTDADIVGGSLEFKLRTPEGKELQVTYAGSPPIEPVSVEINGEEHITLLSHLVLVKGIETEGEVLADSITIINHNSVVVNTIIYLILLASLILMKIRSRG